MRTRLIATMMAVLALFTFTGTAMAEILPGITSKVDYDNTDPGRYVIEIDTVNQIISVYEGGVIVLQGLCTTGNDENITGAGTFKLGQMKERFGYFVAFGQYAQYWTQVVRGIYIHSVMYNSTKLSSMSKSAYNGLGKALSHGCVRVLPEVARWIYYNCPPGTTCKVVRKAKNPELAKLLKSQMVSYSKYVQQKDDKPYPPIIKGTIKFDKVPVRTGFSSWKDKTVQTLKAGDTVDILQLSASWLKVKTKRGKLGYVQTGYVKFDPESHGEPAGGVVPTPTPTLNPNFDMPGTDFPSVTPSPFVVHDARIRPDIRANVRDMPTSLGSRILAVLEPNTVVTLLSVTGTWYYIQSGSVNGYVSGVCLAA